MPNIRIDRPMANELLVIGTTCHVAGLITGDGGPEPVHLDSATVQVGDQPPVGVTFAPVITHPPQKVPTYTFQADVQVSGPAGPTTVVLSARFDSDNDLTASRPITTRVATATPALQKVYITFNSHNDGLNDDTVLHVFVKNRRAAKPRGDSATTSLSATTYIDNRLAFEEARDRAPEFNPFLGFGENLTGGHGLGNNSTHQFDIPLRATPIPLEEVALPIVNIHILPADNDRWMFDYTITFTFDDGRSFSSSSNVNGVTGIILDQDNKDYAGICTENPFIPLPDAPKPNPDAVLTRLVLEFSTHNENKNSDTKVNVHVVNRLSATAGQDLSIALDVLSGQEFKDPSYHSVDLPLVPPNIRLQDMVLPEVNINIVPSGNDRWIFDYRITFFFTDSSTGPGVFREPFSSTTSGVILDQDHHKHTGVYSGRPFPTFASPPTHLTPFAIDHVFHPKTIPLSYVRKKLDDFINNRQGTGSQYPPLRKVRFHNTGRFTEALPESYVDLQSIDNNPPPPRSVGLAMDVKYNSSPSSLGQIKKASGFGDLYLNDINSQSLTAKVVDASSPTPIEVVLDFETGGPDEVVGGTSHSVSGMDFKTFTITVRLTLRFDEPNGWVDLMGWVDDINGITYTPASGGLRARGSFLGKPIDSLILINSLTEADIVAAIDNFRSGLIDQVLNVKVVAGTFDFGGSFQKNMRGRLFERLSKPDPITKVSPRDALNATVNSWFLGGVIQSGNTSLAPFPNACRLVAAKVDGDNLVLNYIGPPNSFVYQQPVDWPTKNKPNPKIDFSPGTLANIDHIVVLTMENRSFDHMLGYLSLPESMGGLNRKDVDGLKGNESNLLNGKECRLFRFNPGETIFAPDPPHDTEPVSLAINGGKMDGFAQSYANLRGNAVGPNIMGYHTVDTVPVCDALSRDFAIGHRWFAAHPGPTFCNRFYELTGRLNIDPWGFWEYSNSSPLRPVFTDTIFDHLSAQNVSWKYFEHFYCFLRFFERHTYDSTNIVSFDDPVSGFEALARSGNLPSVSFIDPHFIELPPDGNCDGPPADVKEGQKLVKRIVEAVVTSPKWNKTLLIITYDEHGGFFDHVPPPLATKVSPELVDTFGVRVPTFVISPWVKAGSVFGHDAAGSSPSLYFDHTSILKTIARRFLSQNPPYMGARYAAANDLSSVVGNTLRTGQFLPFIPYNFVYLASKLRLDVQGASSTPGAVLQQFTPNDSIAQQFSFEDAGNGLVYIRTHTGNLYLTADANHGVIQDVKYPTGSGAPPAKNPQTQLWRLTIDGISILDRNKFVISNAAFPVQVLQPAGASTASGSPVVVLAATGGGVHSPNAWQVTSPLLPAGGGGTL